MKLMYYLKTLFFNFLAIFFANHILPGIIVLNQTKLPHIGGDLIFPLVLGFVNSLIFLIFRLFRQRITMVKTMLVTIIINFVAYAILKFLPLGIEVKTVEGYLLVSVIVTICSIFITFLESRHYQASVKIDLPPTV